MSASSTTVTHFDYPEMDWDEYTKHRAPYPKALYDIIYEYHAAHSSKFDRAYDIGAGAGLVTRVLLDKLQRVTLSDPMPQYIDAARKLFHNVPEEKLDYAVNKAEEPLKAEERSLDLITAAECLHWADLPSAIPNLGRYLKSEGTLAVWMYGVHVCYPKDDPLNPLARQAAEHLHRKWTDLFEEKFQITTAVLTMNARFDDMDFSPEIWKDVRRLYWAHDEYSCDDRYPTAASNVHAGEWQERFANHEFLSIDADFEWIKNYYINLIPPLDVVTKLQDELEALKVAMVDAAVKRRVYWPFVLVLATKR